MSPSPPYRHLLEAPLGSPTPTWIAHLIVGRACARIPIKSEKRNETNCIRGRFHAVEHAGGYERSGPQQYYGRGRDAIPDDRYDTLSAGRGLMVCQL